MSLEASLESRARAWMENDPDSEAREEIAQLLAAGNAASESELADRFSGSLEFGTAGLRGVVGAGPNRMNRAVVLRTTAGLARYLLSTNLEDHALQAPRVVVGFDGRHMSRVFAEDTACALAGAGITALLFETEVPTPLLAFAVPKLGCAAGVMVTASHNPAEYNGYKAYWKNGAQIIPPVDIGIASAINEMPAANLVPRPSLENAVAQGLVQILDGALATAYLEQVRALSFRSDGDKSLTIVYTPLHGVGDALARRALDDAGFRNVTSVPEQQAPDARFPTVAFPNPEEKGAMDLALALARAKNADLVLANDPDADRLAVALPDASSPNGYVQLTGNQVGVLLGHYVLTQGLSTAETLAAEPAEPAERLVVASIVSSPMLGVIAADLGAHYEEVLTGFKWIANCAIDRKRENKWNFVFGYEEALGYSVGELVRDKDGIGAAVVFAEIAAVLRAQGTTVLAHLDALSRRYGLFASSQVSLTRKGSAGLAELRAIMAKLRANPPRTFGGDAVASVRDYLAREVRYENGLTESLELPKSDVLAFTLASGNRVIVRPSGTEPKAKIYVDVRENVAKDEPVEAARARAEATRKLLESAALALVTS